VYDGLQLPSSCHFESIGRHFLYLLMICYVLEGFMNLFFLTITVTVAVCHSSFSLLFLLQTSVGPPFRGSTLDRTICFWFPNSPYMEITILRSVWESCVNNRWKRHVHCGHFFSTGLSPLCWDSPTLLQLLQCINDL